MTGWRDNGDTEGGMKREIGYDLFNNLYTGHFRRRIMDEALSIAQS
jgi:hypothetical protein